MDRPLLLVFFALQTSRVGSSSTVMDDRFFLRIIFHLDKIKIINNRCYSTLMLIVAMLNFNVCRVNTVLVNGDKFRLKL